MKHIFLAACVLLGLSGVASAQECPAGQPASVYPGAGFVPSFNCQGWVPANHPLARRPVPVEPEPVSASAVAQDIVAGLDFPRTGSVVSSVTSIGGWAVDCKLGAFPPVMRIVETKPDGSLREIPHSNFWEVGIPRPDVQGAYGGVCPAVYHVPTSDGKDSGPNQGFGWSLPIAAVTEPGVHTFTVTFAWPAQNHAGATAVSVTVTGVR